MKDIIVTLGAVILGVFIVMMVVMGSNGASLKSGAQNVGGESKTHIDAMIGTTPGTTPTTTWP